MSHGALHDDIDALHGDAATRRGVAVDHQQAAAAGRAGRLRGITFYVDLAGDHVLGDALAGIAMDDDVCLLVHAGAVVAHMSLDLDRYRYVHAGGDRMLATRVETALTA